MPDAVDEAQSRMLAAQELDLTKLDNKHAFQVIYRDNAGRVKTLDLKGKLMTASDVGDLLYNRGVVPARGGRYARGYYDEQMGLPVIKGNDPELEAELSRRLTPKQSKR